MKSYKNLFIAFIILFASFAIIVAEEEEDEGGIGEIIGDIIAFIIGEVVGSCLMDTKCSAFLGPIILYMAICLFVLTIILQCCGYKFDDDSSHRYNRRAAIFGAGMGFGATKSLLK